MLDMAAVVRFAARFDPGSAISARTHEANLYRTEPGAEAVNLRRRRGLEGSR